MQIRKGFTLVELIIVICLLAVIAAIAGLNLHAYTLNRNLKSAARDIASDFAVCKERAVSENATYQINFNVAGTASSYTIEKVGDATTLVTKRPKEFGPDISITNANFAGGQQLNFLARGTVAPLTPPPVTPVDNSVVLANSRNSTATVTITMTGRTYVTFTIK